MRRLHGVPELSAGRRFRGVFGVCCGPILNAIYAEQLEELQNHECSGVRGTPQARSSSLHVSANRPLSPEFEDDATKNRFRSHGRARVYRLARWEVKQKSRL
jgi:hypothetical protein